jgi:hypothetical protein
MASPMTRFYLFCTNLKKTTAHFPSRPHLQILCEVG